MLSTILVLIHLMALLLAWEPSEHAAGYRLSYGLAPGQYSTVLDVGLFTMVSVGGLDVGQTYYFAATAYNAAGESGPSNEVICEVREKGKHACRSGHGSGRDK